MTFPSSRIPRSPARSMPAVEVDDEIPAEHYKAVAQVIGYVMRLAKQTRFWR